MSDKMYNLSAPEADTFRRYVGHWTERYQVSPEEFCRTFYDQQTGQTMNAARVKDVMNGDSNLLSQQDIDVFARVACAELYEAEKHEVEDWKRERLYGSDRPVPRTISDVIDEINAQLAKG
jgi:hypothetical protein